MQLTQNHGPLLMMCQRVCWIRLKSSLSGDLGFNKFNEKIRAPVNLINSIPLATGQRLDFRNPAALAFRLSGKTVISFVGLNFNPVIKLPAKKHGKFSDCDY